MHPLVLCRVGGSFQGGTALQLFLIVPMRKLFRQHAVQKFALLRGLHSLAELGYPVLAGVSRKSMIYKLLGTTPAEALNGTTALHWECLRQGAVILRAHDTREAVEVVRMFDQFMQA